MVVLGPAIGKVGGSTSWLLRTGAPSGSGGRGDIAILGEVPTYGAPAPTTRAGTDATTGAAGTLGPATWPAEACPPPPPECPTPGLECPPPPPTCPPPAC